jgi:hypothetical protein
MPVRVDDLLRVFGAENDKPFNVWTYSTLDGLAEVLAKGYFRRCHRELRLGDLIFCGTDQPADHTEIETKRDRRRCLLMVTSVAAEGIEVRLVQDWGSPEAAPEPGPAPRKRAPALLGRPVRARIGRRLRQGKKGERADERRSRQAAGDDHRTRGPDHAAGARGEPSGSGDTPEALQAARIAAIRRRHAPRSRPARGGA